MRWIALASMIACAPEPPAPPPVEDNGPPEVRSAQFRCEGPIEDEIWVFAAEVDDPDGAEDVTEVTVLVYDEETDELSATYVLARSADQPTAWTTQVSAAETGLDCAYLRYAADFVAVDGAGNSAATTTWLDAEIAN